MLFGSLTFEDARDHILAAVFVVTGIFLMVSRDEGGLKSMRAVTITVASYLEQPLASIRHYRLALKTNSDLQRQNILLNDELSRLRSAAKELESLRSLVGLKAATTWNMTPVSVVGKTMSGLSSSITVDAGALDSVAIGMPFLTAKGLVGSVTLTSSKYAQILPFTHPMFRASGRVQGSRAFGIISYSGNANLLTMNYVPLTVEIQIGAVVETSGYSFSYPPGIPIGRVVSAIPQPGKDYQIITLEPFQSISDLSEGFIMHFKADTALIRMSSDFEALSK